MNILRMTRKQPFLSALDYVFYMELHVEREKLECFDQLRHSSLPGYDTELPKLCEILKKLVDDLQTSSDSFVSDFVDSDGIHCVLNLLRLSLSRQQSPGSTVPTNGTDILNNTRQKCLPNKERHLLLKRALVRGEDTKKEAIKKVNRVINGVNMNNEYDSLVSLTTAVKRNTKALDKMVSHKTGLSTITSCIVSNLIKSRLIALQLLTKVCDQPFGANKVLEALATMRIIFGESVRFKFLVSMINSCHEYSANGIECYALQLINALLSKTSNFAERVRLQCELQEAGLDIQYLKKTLSQQNIQKSDLIWKEIDIFSNQYIDINNKNSRNNSYDDRNELKEEVVILQKALHKLEADKISLLTIERQLKEKCEDLEQEVDHLKNKFNILMPTESRSLPPQRTTGSDNGTGDSGQWSDCDIEANKSKQKQKFIQNELNKNSYDCDQNMKNEEEFIYVPAILPPKDFEEYAEREQQSSSDFKSNNKSLIDDNYTFRYQKPYKSERRDGDSRWKQRQRNLSREDKSREDITGKPLIVDVLPKYSSDKYTPKCSESTIGMDRENSEFVHNWNYCQTNGGVNNKFNDQNYPKPLSRSMNHINNVNNNRVDNNRSDPLNSIDLYQSALDSSKTSDYLYKTPLKPLSKSVKEDLSQSNGTLSLTRNKKKNIKSSLQSYFFSGNTTLKQNKKKFQSIDSIDSSFKSFPLPKTYMKNFILKGHGNCGLYSGNEPKNLSDDLKSSPVSDNNNLSALVHREITEAARDVGAWM